tara:strand:+ start:3125 stop:3319 length:195 start_codon:yes stop_codon:yes gene_type:complete
VIEVVVEFIIMGGHAYYIWPAYIIATVGILSLWFFSIRELKYQKQILANLKEDISQKTQQRKCN